MKKPCDKHVLEALAQVGNSSGWPIVRAYLQEQEIQLLRQCASLAPDPQSARPGSQAVAIADFVTIVETAPEKLRGTKETNRAT